MIAFHGSDAIKQKYLERVRAHQAADELRRGTGWDPHTSRGCAIGCTLHVYDHAQYELELGIPEALARLEDTLFEGMPLRRSRYWPAEFLDFIQVGADLSQVWEKFILEVLHDMRRNVSAAFHNIREDLDRAIFLYEEKAPADPGISVGQHIYNEPGIGSAAWEDAIINMWRQVSGSWDPSLGNTSSHTAVGQRVYSGPEVRSAAWEATSIKGLRPAILGTPRINGHASEGPSITYFSRYAARAAANSSGDIWSLAWGVSVADHYYLQSRLLLAILARAPRGA